MRICSSSRSTTPTAVPRSLRPENAVDRTPRSVAPNALKPSSATLADGTTDSGGAVRRYVVRQNVTTTTLSSPVFSCSVRVSSSKATAGTRLSATIFSAA